MPDVSAVEVVQAWLDAANSQDIDRLIALSDPGIELVGPRGSGHGHQFLRDWLGRAGLHLQTLRVFARGSAVVVAQHGVWRSGEVGDVIGEQDVASRFVVDDDRVSRFARHDALDEALAAAGLTVEDEIVDN
jgi:hypothetical protein